MQGGGFPLPGVQRANQAVNGKVAWNVNGNNATPALATVNDRMLELWSTPHGVVKAAQAAAGKLTVEEQKTARGEPTGIRILTFPVGNTTFKANVSKENTVTRVEYTIDTPMIGDTAVVALFSQYTDRGDGVKFPSRIVRTQGASPTIKMDGYPVLTLAVEKFAANPKPALDVPEAVQKAAATPPAAAAVTTQKVAEGVVFLSGQGANSVAVEFADHIVLIEAPQGDALTAARFDAARKAFANKPVRYLVNTHHHFDHAGGLRAAVAEDATIVTNGWNRLYYEKLVAAPHTLNPDRLAKTPKKATMEFVGTDFGQGREVHEMTDGKRKLQIFRVAGSQHADAMLIVISAGRKNPHRGRHVYAASRRHRCEPGDDGRDADHHQSRTENSLQQHQAPEPAGRDDRAAPRPCRQDGRFLKGSRRSRRLSPVCARRAGVATAATPAPPSCPASNVPKKFTAWSQALPGVRVEWRYR